MKIINNDCLVTYGEHEPGDGLRYSGFKVMLPGDVEGGKWDTHWLFTLYSPFSRSYVFPPEVDANYIVEKLNMQSLPQTYVQAVCELMAGMGFDVIGFDKA